MAGDGHSARSLPQCSSTFHSPCSQNAGSLQQPVLSPHKDKITLNPFSTGSHSHSHCHSHSHSHSHRDGHSHSHSHRFGPGSILADCSLYGSSPRRIESSPSLVALQCTSLGPSTLGKLKCERATSLWAFQLWRWKGPSSPTPPHSPCALQATGLSWPAVFLLLAAVSALTAVATHGAWPQVRSPPRRAHQAPSPASDMRYWRRFEKEMRASAAPALGRRMVVLVTGSAGFVGSHLALALRQRGDGVLGLDNFNSYYDPALKRAREAMLREAGVFTVHGDTTNADLLSWLFQRIAFTHVAHMAAQAGVRYAMENPQSYVHSNVAGFVSVLEACRKADPQPAVVWASSSSVYGLNRRRPFSEAHRTDRPASLYGATKKAGEVLAHSYNHIHGLSVTGLRFFTVYGPWGRPDMAYFSFTRDILSGRAIKIFTGPGNAEVARDFTYIDDVVNGCISALDTAHPSNRSKKGHPPPMRIFNLGNTNPVSVATLVSILEDELGTKAKRTVIRMPRNGDVPYTHANVSAASYRLGYKPSTSLRTGLKTFVAWYLEHYSRNESLPMRQ